MVGYKLSKNDWVTPFLVIFRSVREKLLVTVFLDHPVSVRIVTTFSLVRFPDPPTLSSQLENQITSKVYLLVY